MGFFKKFALLQSVQMWNSWSRTTSPSRETPIAMLKALDRNGPRKIAEGALLDTPTSIGYKKRRKFWSRNAIGFSINYNILQMYGIFQIWEMKQHIPEHVSDCCCPVVRQRLTAHRRKPHVTAKQGKLVYCKQLQNTPGDDEIVLDYFWKKSLICKCC